MYVTSNVGDIVKQLRQQISCNEFDMVVRRSRVLSDTLHRLQRISFDPKLKLNVSTWRK